MSDLINRHEAFNAINNKVSEYLETEEMWRNGYLIGLCEAYKAVEALPAAQLEIIRCRDCMWFGEPGCAIEILDSSDRPRENDFCSFAERKSNDE